MVERIATEVDNNTIPQHIRKVDIINSIFRLNQIIEQESHNLRLPATSTTNEQVAINEDKLILFAQQVHICSYKLNNKDIAEKSRKFLSKLNMPFLNIIWTNVSSTQGLIRTMDGHSDSVYSVAISPDNNKIVSGSSEYDSLLFV